MPYILPSAKHPALRLQGTTRLSLRLSMAHSGRKTIKNNFIEQQGHFDPTLEIMIDCWANELTEQLFLRHFLKIRPYKGNINEALTVADFSVNVSN